MYTKLIREIRDAISNRQLPTEFIVDLSAEYAEAVEVVNTRLNDIVKILSDGYRDEAIELAEQVPPLLDLVAQLDFPEREQWDEVLADSLLEQSPQIMLGAAEQLEQAYEERQAIAPLLEKHRLLAMAQAPLKSRIFILKKLAQKDPTNPIWIDDTRMLQKARLSQIKTEFQIAKKRKNTDQLNLLTQELAEPWDVPIPKQLQVELQGTTKNLVRNDAKAQMQQIAARLNDCLSEFDRETAEGLRLKWNELNQIARLPPTDEVFQLGQEPLRWLDSVDEEDVLEESFQTAISQLEYALDAQLPIDQLDRKIYEVHKFERDIPATLTHRVNQYRSSLESGRRRKTWLMTGSALAVLIACAIAITLFISNRNQQKIISANKTQMQAFVDESAFDSGEQFFNALDTAYQNDAEIIRLINQLKSDKQAEDTRLESLDQLIALVDLKGPLEINLDDFLREAEQLSATSDEKQQVEALKNRLNSERQIRQNKRNQIFLDKLKPIQAELESLVNGKADATTTKKLDVLIEKIEKSIYVAKERVDGKAGVSRLIEQTAENLSKKAKSRIENIAADRKSMAAFALLKTKTGTFPRYAQGLEDYAQKFPDNLNSAEFKVTAREVKFWEGFRAWQLIAKQVDPEILFVCTPEEADALLDQIEAAKSINVGIADKAINELVALLERQKLKPTNGLNNIKLLKSYFDQSEFADLEIAVSGNEFYYLAQPFDPNTDKTFKYFTDNSGTAGTSKKDFISRLAPHCLVSQQVTKKLDAAITSLKPGPTDAAIEGNINELIIELASVVSGDGLDADSLTSLDPLVQCEYLNQILLFTTLMSPELKSFAETQIAAMQGKKLTRNDWKAADSDLNENDSLRKIASRFLATFKKELDEEKEVSGVLTNELKEMSQWVELSDYRLVGLLYRIDDKWLVDSSIKIDDDQELYCVLPDENGSAKIQSMGVYKSDSLESNSFFQAGRLIYINPLKK